MKPGWYRYHRPACVSMDSLNFGPLTLGPRTLLLPALLPLLKLHDDELCHGLEGVENTGPFRGHGLEIGKPPGIQRILHLFNRDHIRQVALVVLDYIGNSVEIVSLLGQIDPEVL